jgi:hypothetical protein
MDDWLDAFVDSMKATNSPAIFQKWAAVCVLGGAMERKCWIETSIGTLYPNMYVVLVAPPGVGKSVAIRRARDAYLSLKSHHLASSSVTKASLIDTLNESVRTIITPDQIPASRMFNSLQVISSEMGVLLPSYDPEFMHVLTDLYDCDVYSERRRTNKISIEMKAPQVSMLAACTPNYLTSVLPEGAWEQGFASRLILIYSGDVHLVDLFSEQEIVVNEKLNKELKVRADTFGKFRFTAEAISMITEWRAAGETPVPDHPKLINYRTRRTSHILKLSMIMSMSESTDLIIDERHVERALNWLLEAEFFMPEIFKAMSGTSHGQLISETWHFVYKTFMKDKQKPVAKARIVNYLQARTPAHNVPRVLEVMESAGVLKKSLTSSGEAYTPIKGAE